MIITDNIIQADDNKLLRRIINKEWVGKMYSLGYIYYINGVLLPAPHLEVPDDFEDLSSEDYFREHDKEYSELVDAYIRERYSQSNEFAILRQRDTKPEAFQEYFSYCEECKKRAKEDIIRDYPVNF